MITRILGVACLAFAVGGAQANAAQEIGQAVSAKNVVNGKLGGNVRRVKTGNDVLADEIITTGASSAALLKFLDNSNLDIGASSTVVLDKFVYNPNGSAQSVVINLSRGAMRFVSGRSEPRNFKIQTQVATLGVRGTDFVTICTFAACAVVVASGIVSVCPRPCRESYQVNATRNFTIIDRNGRTTVKSIPKATVARIIRGVQTGRNGLTITSIESGQLSPSPRSDSRNARTGINATPRNSGGGGGGGASGGDAPAAKSDDSAKGGGKKMSSKSRWKSTIRRQVLRHIKKHHGHGHGHHHHHHGKRGKKR